MTDEQVERIVTMTSESKPRGATHRSTRSLTAHLDVSHNAVWLTWQALSLQPHREERFNLFTARSSSRRSMPSAAWT